jgi:hypothetical protein
MQDQEQLLLALALLRPLQVLLLQLLQVWTQKACFHPTTRPTRSRVVL